MPENILPDSGTIDLNNSTSNSLQTSEDNKNLVVTDENQELRPVVDIPPIEIIETVPEPTKIDDPSELFSANSDNTVPPEKNDDYETGKINPKVLAVSAIVAGILIMSAGYVAYRYFSSTDMPKMDTSPVAGVQVYNGDTNDYEGIIDDLNGRITSGVSTSRAEEWEVPGDSAGIVMTNSENSSNTLAQQNIAGEESERSNTNLTLVANTTTEPTSTQIQTNATDSTWRANNYKFGDVKSGTYTVKRGDTLWELAEAAYGNGSDWHKLAQANKTPNLPNGNPLIIPGQILNIPT